MDVNSAQTPQPAPPGAPPEEPMRVKTEAATDRKCPQCGGTMDFDPGSGGLACPYCGHKEAIAQKPDAPTSTQELDFGTAEQTANHDWGAEKKTVICKSCGAQSIYDALQVASECPYCGSNQVMEAAAADTMAPGGVCVFKIDAKTAGERFKSWIKGKLFCPGLAKQKAKPESFQGIYLPFWTFDAQTRSEYSGRFGKNRTVRDSEGNTRIVVDWYPTAGVYDEFIDDHLVAASTQHNRDFLRGLEPFDTAGNLSYKPEYVAGFAAERYSVGLKDAWEIAKQMIYSRLMGGVEQKVQRETFADMVEITSLRTAYSKIKFKYLLLPVWISSFKFKEKIYNFMVNGQTGKVDGKTPVSPLRVAVAVLIGIVVLALLYMMFSN